MYCCETFNVRGRICTQVAVVFNIAFCHCMLNNLFFVMFEDGGFPEGPIGWKRVREAVLLYA